ncbi:MAG: AmmeMemoRadiSam system protein B [Acidobacteriota bacterium]|jgi:AmmeMemoRadiSam system protein B/AmmeMemoRadiSam system protein A
MKIFSIPLFSVFIALFVYIPSGACGDLKLSGIRQPAAAGQFYSSDPAKLELAIRQFLHDSSPIPMEDPLAIVVPHAGYIYSGQICADAFRQVMNRRYDTFVILGVNHTTGGFQGVSLADYESFRTPLGDIPIDETVTAELLAKCTDCVRSREVHLREHSIEVQVPFIQVLFPDAKIVPVIIHPPDPDLCMRFGKILAGVLKDKKALIVISSDLSHYPDSAEAFKKDRETLEAISSLDPENIVSVMHDLNAPNLDTRACGEAGIVSGITAAGLLGATQAVVAGYSNSGDIAVGDRTRVVGYGAVVLVPGNTKIETSAFNRPKAPDTATPLEDSEKRALLTFARKTLRQYLTSQTVPLARNFPARLSFKQGVFVTLKSRGLLRGCIGNILPKDELCKSVGTIALQAALNDPRFPPVAAKELDDLEIEISLLTPLKSISDPDQIVVGQDGVLLTKEGKSAVFLPQVAPENNWNRTQMLDNLCTKALLPSGCWKQNARLETFQAEVFSE